jgi:uridine kinase
MAERGHSLDSIKKSIEARKPDFDAYIDPQKKDADMIIQVRACVIRARHRATGRWSLKQIMQCIPASKH